MTIQNITLNTTSEKKKQGRPKGSTVAAKIEKKSVKEVENSFMDFIDGDNEGEGGNIELLLNGKKVLYKKRYQVYLSGLKKKFDPDKDLYFKDYVEPKWVVFDRKEKINIFEIPSNMGNGFIKLCQFCNNL